MTSPNSPSTLRAVLIEFSGIDSEKLRVTAETVVPSPFRRRFKNSTRARAHWAGRSAIAYLLHQARLPYFVVPDATYGYLRLYTAEGKAVDEWYCNLSHTENVAVAVLGPAPVGIDVESPERFAGKVLGRAATEAERRMVSHYAEKSFPFSNPGILLWSAKEAFSKALGLGMKFGFQHFHVDLTTAFPFPSETSLKGPLTVKSPAVIPTVRDGFLITICTENEVARTEVEWSSLRSLDFTGISRGR